MAPRKPQSLTVEAHRTDEGGLELGVVLERTFVPLASVDKGRLGQLLENRQHAAESADDDNESEG